MYKILQQCRTWFLRKYTLPNFNSLCIMMLMICISSFTYAQLQTGFSQVLVANTISSPTVFAFAPDGRIFIAQQTGQLRVVKNGTLLTKPFVTIMNINSSGERGLLGVAFDPLFASNQFVYLYYTVGTAPIHNRISRFTASGDTALAGSELAILDLENLSATNHNGGCIAFGPDGKLYVGVGENAVGGNAQITTNHLGKILRINSDGSTPAGNPFSGSTPASRIWEMGMRNPYTLTFQPGTGRLFVNDVGQSAWEEINDCTTGGLNYGWNTVEGVANNPSFKDPIYAYGHGSGTGIGCAITGGTFFNPTSTNYPQQYIGRYFFFDFCGTWIDQLTLSGTTATRSNFGTGIAGSPVSMQTGPDGNLYFLSRSNSAIYKITYTAAPVITQQPQSITVAAGSPASFSVTATGTAPLSYQWKKGTGNISGATNSVYNIVSTTTGDAGTYSVVVSNAAGTKTSNDATLTVTTGSTTVTLNPVADAYVIDGTPNTNFGTATEIITKKYSGNGYKRESYIRFDISSFTNSVSNAKLRLNGALLNSQDASATVEVHNVSNITWGENTITWNSRPTEDAASLGAKVISGTTKVYYEWDLTSYISSAKNSGATFISLKIINITNTENNYSTFNSKEAASNKPQLVVTTGGGGSTVTHIISKQDAYVQAGGNANNNFGSATTIICKLTPDVNWKRETYLKFDITSVTTPFTNAKLRLYGSLLNTTDPSEIVEVHNVVDTTWKENVITWNTKPAEDVAILASQTIIGTGDNIYEWDLTSYITSAKSAGKKEITLKLISVTNSSGNYIDFNSKEAGVNRPELQITSGAREEEVAEILMENNAAISFSIYPNPATDNVTIAFTGISDYKFLRLYDISGKLVKIITLNGDQTQSINISDITEGIYFASIEIEKGIETKKLLIAR